MCVCTCKASCMYAYMKLRGMHNIIYTYMIHIQYVTYIYIYIMTHTTAGDLGTFDGDFQVRI